MRPGGAIRCELARRCGFPTDLIRLFKHLGHVPFPPLDLLRPLGADPGL